MFCRKAVAAFCATAVLSATAALAGTTLNTLVTFTSGNGGNTPLGGLVADASGNLYGTTTFGGPSNGGTVFKIANGTDALSTLLAFTQSQGEQCDATLLADALGNLYGTAENGGSYNVGTVFKITAGTNAVSVLVTFNTSNGANPVSTLIADGSGNLYGTTAGGGPTGVGTVFKVAAGTNALSTLATFDNLGNGGVPNAGLIADASGNLYGTTAVGGANTDGTIFKVATGTNTLSTLVTFNSANGEYPYGSLIADSAGNLYGTTNAGGASGDGTVFKVAAGTHTLTTLAAFNGSNGANPYGNLIMDAAGNLYGTTYIGGSSNDGTVFKISAGTDILITLSTFNSSNGADPYSGLTADANGDLFGTTKFGGSSNVGTVYEVTGAGFVVPEPSSMTLAAVGGVALLRRRRPSRHIVTRCSPRN